MNLASAITSGTTTLEGGGTIPPPPAVTGAWLSGLGYWTMKSGTLWLAGYQGTLTPPAGTDTDHITAIRVSRLVSGQRSVLLSLAGPFPVGGARGFKSDAIDVVFSGPVTLEFVTENEDGSTATYTTTVTLTAPSEASVTAAEATPISTTRHQTENRGVRSVLNFTPVVSNPLWPLPITVWTNHPSAVRKHRGVLEMAGPGALQLGAVGTKSEFDIIPPTAADESWTLTYAIGSFDELTAPPVSAKTSAPFTMLRPPAPGTTEATGAYVDAITYAKGPGGASMFGLPHIYVTLPLGSNNFLHGRLKLQTGTGTGGAFVAGGAHPIPWNVGDWVDDDDHSEGFYRVPGTNQIYCNVPNVWDVPSDGNTTHRLWWEVASRRDGGTEVQQNAWSSGVGVSTPGTAAYQDVVVDGTKSQISTGPGTIPDGHGGVRLNTDNFANVVFNPSFENDFNGWKQEVGTSSIQSGITPATGTVTGSKRLLGNTLFNQWGVTEVTSHSTRPGDVWYLEAYAGVYNGPGDLYLKAIFYDADDTTVLGYVDVAFAATPNVYTLLKGTAAHLTGASFVRVFLYLFNATASTGVIADNVWMSRQTPTGDGTEPDGKGGVRWRPGAGLKIGVSGAGEANLGNGTQFNGNQIELKLGNGMSFNAGAAQISAANGFKFSFGQLDMNLGNGLNISGTALQVNTGNGVTAAAGALTLNLGNGLIMTGAAATVNTNGNGMGFNSGALEVKTGSGLSIISLAVAIPTNGVSSGMVASVGVDKLTAGSMIVSGTTGITIQLTGSSQKTQLFDSHVNQIYNSGFTAASLSGGTLYMWDSGGALRVHLRGDSSNMAVMGLYVNGNRVVGPRQTDPGLANFGSSVFVSQQYCEALRQILLAHGLI